MTEDAKTAPDISAENVARMVEGLTLGPWVYFVDDYQGEVEVYVDYRVGLGRCVIHSHKIGVYEFGDDKRIANARFIAWTREAVPAMAEALKAAKAEIEKLRAALSVYGSVCDAEDPESCGYTEETCCKTARAALGLKPGGSDE